MQGIQLIVRTWEPSQANKLYEKIHSQTFINIVWECIRLFICHLPCYLLFLLIEIPFLWSLFCFFVVSLRFKLQCPVFSISVRQYFPFVRLLVATDLTLFISCISEMFQILNTSWILNEINRIIIVHVHGTGFVESVFFFKLLNGLCRTRVQCAHRKFNASVSSLQSSCHGIAANIVEA